MEDSLESVRGLLKLGEYAVCAVDSCFAGLWHGGRMAAARRYFVGLSKNKKRGFCPRRTEPLFCTPALSPCKWPENVYTGNSYVF